MSAWLGWLYLDSARLGLTSTNARLALRDFVGLTADMGCSQYFEQLFYGGFAPWPAALRAHYPGLKHWQGIAALKGSLRKLAQAPPGSEPLLAGRSAQLMRLAAKLLADRCRRILITDLSWPGYASILEQEAGRRRKTELIPLDIRTAFLDGQMSEDQMSEDDLIEHIARRFRRERCDGLFLPAVSNDGIKLPLERICRTLGYPRTPKFVVIDGAQALCHTGCRPGIALADMYLSGCHKWLQAGSIPLGMAFSPRRRSRELIRQTAEHMLSTAELDDPLLRFIAEIETGQVSRFSETVNLASLFSCQAAVHGWRREHRSLPRYLDWQLQTADRIAAACGELGWQPLLPDRPLRCGILLLRAKDRAVRALPADTLRDLFQEQGITLTAYDDGVIRLALPQVPFRRHELDDLDDALAHCGRIRTSAIPTVSTPVPLAAAAG